MPEVRRLLLAGAAAIMVAVPGTAPAQTPNTHLMTVRLPDGGVAEIRYAGDIAPEVTVHAGPASRHRAPAAAFFPVSPFAMLDRISAEMDQRAAAMIRQAEALASASRSGGLTEIAAGGLPPGSESFTFVSTVSTDGVCSQSVRITSSGDGAPPRVERHSSGNCDPGAAAVGPAPGGPATLPATPMRSNGPDVVLTGGQGMQPHPGWMRPILAGRR